MADKHNGGSPVPDGWELRTASNQKLVSEDLLSILKESRFATAQHFFTYEELMRYVKYAKEAELSIYAPDFESNKHRGKPIRRRHRTNYEPLNSRPLPVNQGLLLVSFLTSDAYKAGKRFCSRCKEVFHSIFRCPLQPPVSIEKPLCVSARGGTSSKRRRSGRVTVDGKRKSRCCSNCGEWGHTCCACVEEPAISSGSSESL